MRAPLKTEWDGSAFSVRECQGSSARGMAASRRPGIRARIASGSRMSPSSQVRRPTSRPAADRSRQFWVGVSSVTVLVISCSSASARSISIRTLGEITIEVGASNPLSLARR